MPGPFRFVVRVLGMLPLVPTAQETAPGDNARRRRRRRAGFVGPLAGIGGARRLNGVRACGEGERDSNQRKVPDTPHHGLQR